MYHHANRNTSQISDGIGLPLVYWSSTQLTKESAPGAHKGVIVIGFTNPSSSRESTQRYLVTVESLWFSGGTHMNFALLQDMELGHIIASRIGAWLKMNSVRENWDDAPELSPIPSADLKL